jgi:hypothetical protein
LGREPSNDLAAVALPGDRLLVADENGALTLVDPAALVGVDEDLLPVLDGLADAGDGGDLPPGAAAGPQGQLLLWPDGRAVLTRAISGDAATLLLHGRPVQVDAIAAITDSHRNWQRVRDAALSGVFRSGIYQLGTYPVSRFMGVNLPSGSRIRFANPAWPS